MAERPRILVLRNGQTDGTLTGCEANAELVFADSLARAAALLQREAFTGVYADTSDLQLLHQVGTLFQADRVLEQLPDGIALLDPQRAIRWANATFRGWSGLPAVEGKTLAEALGAPALDAAAVTTLQLADGRTIQLQVSPVRSPRADLAHYLAVGHDVTAERQQQQKLEAIHRAGEELADLSPDELAHMSVEERLELLKSNILRYVHDLLRYDQIDIRLLDPATGKLELLISEGMRPETKVLSLYAQETGNGVSGYVAATGKSRLCPDTSKEPLYIQGAEGAKSSLTVPLVAGSRVIGTFNVESPIPHAFTEQDRQFLEIFSRRVADALHLLDLLVAERRGTAVQSIELVSREVALPVDEILTAATGLLDRYIGHDEDMDRRLRHILQNARSVKQVIQKVGETVTPPAAGSAPAPPPQPLRGLRVLVVDNDERVRRSAHSLLGRFGCIVETAHDGREAIAMARLGSYDAVLVDIRLPDLNGYEAFHKLRTIRPDLEVVFMSGFGYDPGHSIVKARQEGLRSVLYKPFRVDQLLDALAKAPRPNAPAAPEPGRA